MRTDLFDYHLPRELIAAVPAARREESRLMVLTRASGRIEHRRFYEIMDHLRAGDLMVLNDSRVIRARLHGKRLSTGGTVEFLLLERVRKTDAGGSELATDTWRALCRPARKLKPGERVYFANKRLEARITHYLGEGEREIEFFTPDVQEWLDKIGEVPLPPYIIQRRREIAGESGQTDEAAVEELDAERYQTVYARDPGSVAAPTAGLHFSRELLDSVRRAGVEIATVTLHVGAGTFKPVETENIHEHPMHTEHFTISPETAEQINRARADQRRIIAVGTTSVRALESAADDRGQIRAGNFDTNLMIFPGYRFKAVDVLLTNFHLPRSTLLMLVSAFAGREFILSAYEEAVREKYRFFSYGDAMLML